MRKQRRSSKQNGGTLLGIVLGLTVGLAIAVVVALYVTRAPTPFVTKTAPAPSAESLNSQASADPNRLLQGRSPSQPVAPAGSSSEPGSGLQRPGSMSEPQIVEVPSSAGALNSGQAVNKSELASNGANSSYYLQVGAYKTRADAEQQRAKLALQGFESKVTRYESAGILYYRVRLGPFTRFEQMNQARLRLTDAGIDTAIIRPPSNK